jgi:hypothetical protein
MKTALITIASGAKYVDYAKAMFESAKKFLPFAEQLTFKDGPVGFPNATLYRYHTFLKDESILRQYDYIFYSDADMLFVAPVTEEEIFSDGITATLHPGFAHERKDEVTGITTYTCGTPERANKESRAYIPRGTWNKYFCGGFNGGTSEAYLRMARKLREDIDWDKENWGLGYSAIWHDESYMNRYLYDNPPAKILTPSFCYPENYDGGYGWKAELYPPKLIALNKAARGGR